jgi:hypothetical protein
MSNWHPMRFSAPGVSRPSTPYELLTDDINQYLHTMPPEDPNRGLLQAFLQAREALVLALGEKFGTTLNEEGESEWRDCEVDDALARYTFWWTWGN